MSRAGGIVLILFLCSLPSFGLTDSECLNSINTNIENLYINFGVFQVFFLIFLGLMIHKSYTDGLK